MPGRSIAGAISTLAHFGMFFGRSDDDHRNPVLAILVLILAPIAALLIQLAAGSLRNPRLNPLLRLRYPGTDGIKTGFTDAAGALRRFAFEGQPCITHRHAR